jgi:hypothetical protein
VQRVTVPTVSPRDVIMISRILRRARSSLVGSAISKQVCIHTINSNTPEWFTERCSACPTRSAVIAAAETTGSHMLGVSVCF